MKKLQGYQNFLFLVSLLLIKSIHYGLSKSLTIHLTLYLSLLDIDSDLADIWLMWGYVVQWYLYIQYDS